MAPITFHPAPNTVEPRSVMPPPYNRSTSVSSTVTNREQSQNLSRQSSVQSNSLNFGLVRPNSREGSDKRRDKERAPLSKEAKRLLKQRSQEQFLDHQNHVHNSQSISSIPYIDQTPPTAKNYSQEDEKQEGNSLTSTSPLRQFADEKRRRSNCSTVSTPNLPTVSPTHNALTQTAVQQQQCMTSQKSFQSSSTQLAKIEEKIQGRGMCRSSASYGIQQMLQEQITKDENNAKIALEREMSKVVAAYEERINAIRQEHNLQIQQVLREKSTAINNAKNTFETELQRRISEIEITFRNNLVTEIQNERIKNLSEIESLRLEYEKALSDADQRHRDSIELLQERDAAWQAEKQDVLGEIQRLKEEANRFIAILSQEEEYEKSDQQLSPSKRQALTKEVESLQLVVEMRSSEVRLLREERTKLLEQLNSFENTRNILEKMNARVEDLQAQLEAKSETERQLSLEKSQLESNYETESKSKARMSMQVEELQWRIKNNLELPATKIFTPDSPMSMDDSHWTEISGPMSMTTNQIHSFDEVMLRKPRSTNSSPRKDYFYSNRSSHQYDVWNKGDHKQETNGFCLSSPKKILNNNESVTTIVTPTSSQNNNQFPIGLTTTSTTDGVPVDDREKRDQSTEKHIDIHDDDDEKHLVDIHDDDDVTKVLSTPDSLEDLRTADEDDNKNPNEAGEEEYDEGLGDINHGSEASSSPQPPPTSSSTTTNNINNNNSPDGFHDNNLSLVKPEASTSEKEVCDKKKLLLSSPCDERVPSRIPFSLQTNL